MLGSGSRFKRAIDMKKGGGQSVPAAEFKEMVGGCFFSGSFPNSRADDLIDLGGR